MFELLKKDATSRARLGRLRTGHGVVDTPVFMSVGTQASVKAIDPRELQEMGTQIILGNTYHLSIRPGMEILRAAGGLHRFMNWPGPILTDSGGFQIFSLSGLRKITEEGVTFSSHIDGRRIFMSPEDCIRIQSNIGDRKSVV
jgi:queuine tRNA-ribosyltransferase